MIKDAHNSATDRRELGDDREARIEGGQKLSKKSSKNRDQ